MYFYKFTTYKEIDRKCLFDSQSYIEMDFQLNNIKTRIQEVLESKIEAIQKIK
jgi:hypothetical protein